MDELVLRGESELLESNQRYKSMSTKNIATAVSNAVFHPDFAQGVAFEQIITEAKKWLRQNVFNLYPF